MVFVLPFVIHILKEGSYELHGCAEEKGKLTSLVLPGLEFDLTEIHRPLS